MKEAFSAIVCHLTAACCLQYVVKNPLTGEILSMQPADNGIDEVSTRLGNTHLIALMSIPMTPQIQEDWDWIWA
jgi:hypothetical protein